LKWWRSLAGPNHFFRVRFANDISDLSFWASGDVGRFVGRFRFLQHAACPNAPAILSPGTGLRPVPNVIVSQFLSADPDPFEEADVDVHRRRSVSASITAIGIDVLRIAFTTGGPNSQQVREDSGGGCRSQKWSTGPVSSSRGIIQRPWRRPATAARASRQWARAPYGPNNPLFGNAFCPLLGRNGASRATLKLLAQARRLVEVK
jgi:hypothetical protein